MVKVNKYFVLILTIILLVASVNALADPFDDTRKLRLEFGHALMIENINSKPLSPGSTGILSIMIRNDADFYLKDVRIMIDLPSSINFLNDVSVRKILTMEAGVRKELNFSLIVSPTASEGIYQGSIKADYLNNMGTQRSENYTFSVIVKSTPTIFVKLENPQINKEKDTGDITVTIINNGPANIKFLTVDLQDSSDYEIIGSKKQYVGDLDSDDFESISFKLKILNEMKEISIPLKIQYKNSMNEDYSESINLAIKMVSSKDLGVKSNNTSSIIIAVIVVLLVAYIIYKVYKKKKYIHAKDGFLMPALHSEISSSHKKK
jgi:hypothetical protein